LPEGHSMLRPDGVKEKRYCGFHQEFSLHQWLQGFQDENSEGYPRRLFEVWQ
jgi:hypothetical protein